jgi:hypothetical protein
MNPLLPLLIGTALLRTAMALPLVISLPGPDAVLELVSESPAGLVAEFRLNRFELEHGPAGDRLQVEGFERQGRPGEPWLPGGSRLLAVPPRAALILRVELLADTLLEDFHPAPRPAWISERDGREVLPEARSGAEPEAWATLGPPALWLGQRVVALDVHPLRPDDGPGRWRLATHLRLRVEYGAGEPINPGREDLASGTLARGVLAKAVLNAGGLSATAQRMGGTEPLGRYLVVAPQAALPFLADWGQLRREQGYELTLRSLEELGVGATNWEPIRDEARLLYEGEGLDCLLLVGDMNPQGNGYHLPGALMPGGQYAEWVWGRRIVSDQPLAQLAGDDYFADVLVGRLTADNATQLTTMLNRMLQYEAALPHEDHDWLQRALLVYDMDQAGSRRETSLAIRERLLEAGFSPVDTIRNHRVQSPQSPTLVINALNTGQAFVNYRGYGYRNAWNGPAFSSQHLLALANYGRWPLITSMVCGGGDFASQYYEPCLGEAALQAGTVFEPTGAIVFIGPSEEDTHTKWNNSLTAGLYHGLLAEELRSPAALLERAKLELWLDFPNDREEDWRPAGHVDQATNVPFYFHCYNLLGDPGLELRAGPQRVIAAELPEELPLGLTRLELQALDGDGQPLEGVVACLSGEGGRRLALARSGAEGRIELDCEPLPDESIVLLLHGRDLLPQRRVYQPAAAAARLELRAWQIVEAEPGDGWITAGETARLRLQLHETGSQGGAGGELRLSAMDERCTVLVESCPLPPLQPGDSLVTELLELRLGPSVEHGERLPLRLELVDEGLEQVWSRRLDLTAAGPRLNLAGLQLEDGAFEPGASAGFRLSLENPGPLPLEAGSLRLYNASWAVMMFSPLAPGLLLPPGQTALAGPFACGFAAGLQPGSLLPFELVAFRADGSTACRLPLQIQVGERGPHDPLGPDGQGYLIHHSQQDHPGAPVHQWQDIAAGGILIELEDRGVQGNPDAVDGVSQVRPLPFSFRFYGQDYDTITVCTNGWAALGSWPDHYIGLNTSLPSAMAPPAMIAVFWADLWNHDGNQSFGHLHEWYDADTHRYILQWSGLRHLGYDEGDNRFQLILLDPDWYPSPSGEGELLMVYDEILPDRGPHAVTVGIGAPDRLRGLCYSFNGEAAQGMPALDSHTTLRLTTAIDYGETGLAGSLSPQRFHLLGAAPNPFNPTTRLRLQLPAAGRLGWQLYNLAGQRVLEEVLPGVAAGEIEVIVDGSALASGLYLLRAEWQPSLGPPQWAETKLLLIK